MAANEFQLQIVGQDVTPQSVVVDDLTEVVRALSGALDAIASDSKANEDDVLLALVGVEGAPGRDKLTLFASRESLESARRLVRSLNAAKQESLPHKARSCLRKIWHVIYRNGWDACEFSSNGSDIGNARITRDNELFPEIGTFRGDTVIYGEVIRAGGEGRRTAKIRLLDGSWLTASLKTKELAQQLGERLYQTVGLKGEAIWQLEKKELQQFRADVLTEYTDRDDGASSPRSITQAFNDLSEAAGNRWDHVDPEEFVREQRRD